MPVPDRGAWKKFCEGIERAVRELGGEREADKASGVASSIWGDTKTGKSVPVRRWPEMRAQLEKLPPSVTGVRDWQRLYEAVNAERGRILPAANDRTPATDVTVPCPRQLPPGVRGFIGRKDESDELVRLLLGGAHSTAPVAVVVGLPGVGKSALAVEWAGRAAPAFPDGVLHADLRGWGPDRPLTADEVLPGWLQALGVEPAAMPGDAGNRVSLLRTLLTDRRMLLVLDNASTEDQVRPLLPRSPTCSVLITSRQRMPGLGVSHGVEVVRLEPLSTEESVALLREVLGDRVDREPEEAATLSVLCGHLPLALRVLAETAKSRPDTALATFVAELSDGQQLTALAGDDPLSDLRTVFSWSYRQLLAEVAVVFRRLGLFPGHGLHPHGVAALAGASVATVMPALRTLARLNLVRETATGQIQMHDLLQLYAKDLATAQDSEEQRSDSLRRLFRYYLGTAHRADTLVEPLRYRIPLPDDVEPTPTVLRDQSEALSWFEAERGNVVAMCALDEPDVDTARWQLAFVARAYFFRTKRLHEWIASHEHALAAAVRAKDRSAEAMTRSNLGLARHESGDDTAALVQYEAAQALFEAVGDQHGVSNALAHQAAVLRRRGDHAGSLRLNEAALARYRQVGNLRNVAITLRAIGLAEVELDLLDAASRHLAESLELCRNLGLDMDVARACNTLGQLHLKAGRHDEAVLAFREAIDADEASGGRYETALALRDLGKVAAASGDAARATENWEAALTVLNSLGSHKAAAVEADLVRLRAQSSDHPPD